MMLVILMSSETSAESSLNYFTIRFISCTGFVALNAIRKWWSQCRMFIREA